MQENMIIHIVLLIIGLGLIIKGGDMFVESSIVIARRLRIPRMVIGGTIVSLATTMPELVVSATASFMGNSGIAIGNAVGSAIANIGLIVGTVALLTRVDVDISGFRIRSSWMFCSAVLVIIFSWSLIISRLAGALLLSVSISYLFFDYVHIRKNNAEPSLAEAGPQGMSSTRSLVAFILGALFIIIGSRLLVKSGITIATALGIPSVIIGLSIIAIGTSLPELVTGIVSVRKGVPDLSIGNILGANVLNLAMITGLASVIHPLTLTQWTQAYSFPWLMVFVVVVILMLRKDGTLVTREGIILLTLYVLYIAGLVVLSIMGLS